MASHDESLLQSTIHENHETQSYSLIEAGSQYIFKQDAAKT